MLKFMYQILFFSDRTCNYTLHHNFTISNQFGNSGNMKILFATIFVRYRWLPFFRLFYVLHGTIVTLLPFQACLCIEFVIYSFSTKNTMMVKNENIACGQWIMRLTLILMGALFAQKIEQERVCNIEIFYSFLRLDR